MSEESPNDASSPEREQESDEFVESSENSEAKLKLPTCVKLKLDDHIKAFMEKKVIERDIEPVKCSKELIDKVISNYIIVKQILSNLSWQEKVLCKLVCTTWHSAVQALRREQLTPVDFMMDLRSQSLNWAVLKKSGSFSNEPLAVMTFVNGSGLDMSCPCKLIQPSPCSVPCTGAHSLLDAIQKITSAPKNCMNTVRSDYMSYMPAPNSPTFELAISNLRIHYHYYMVGLFIPYIPDVKFHTINIKSIDMQTEFYDVVQNIAQDRIFKGILVYVTDKYILHTVEDIIFLHHFKELQPDIPYAFGGCIVEDTIFEQNDLNGVVEGINEYRDFFSENLVSISMFTVPKSPQSNECNFNMYSLVLDKSYWTKEKIQQGINEFAKRVPQFEQSVVIKLSCVGRDKKHKWEQDAFRAAFPNTRLVGCYGNGELGIDHPPKPPETKQDYQNSKQDIDHPSVKRLCRESEPLFEIVYSYSTVFVYMGWGKILSNGPL